MRYITLGYYYSKWHYSRAYNNIINIWMNAFWFVYNFFSIGILFSTLFSPWKRIHEQYRKGFDPSEFFSSMLVNIIMRIVGAVTKTFIIVTGIIALAIVLIGGVAFLIIWTFLPIILFSLIVHGVSII